MSLPLSGGGHREVAHVDHIALLLLSLSSSPASATNFAVSDASFILLASPGAFQSKLDWKMPLSCHPCGDKAAKAAVTCAISAQ